MGEREVPSRLIGELVMKELRKLDEVAYVRFASVYRSFQDVTEFQDEVKRLQKKPKRKGKRAQLSLLPDIAEKSEKKKWTISDESIYRNRYQAYVIGFEIS